MDQEYIYGYPVDVWNSMSEDEQIAIQDRAEYAFQHPDELEWSVRE